MDLEDEEGTNIVGGRGIGLCDICRTKRIRWFCRADSAYLCHTCDNSVHSANSVACRHERIQLTHHGILSVCLMSSWPTKRTRSKRAKKSMSSQDDDVFGPHTDLNVELFLDNDSEIFSFNGDDNSLDSLYRDDGLELKDSEGSSRVDDMEGSFSWAFLDRVKVENTDCEDMKGGVPEGLFDLNIDISDFTVNTENDVKVNEGEFNGEEGKPCLMLNYEDVLSAWSDKGLPWAHHNAVQDEMASEETAGTLYGVVPDLNMGNEGHGDQVDGVQVINFYCNEEKKYGYREGREARVIRYREKRRSRLFSKRIRYHVRKLNAEKRPRMKVELTKVKSEFIISICFCTVIIILVDFVLLFSMCV